MKIKKNKKYVKIASDMYKLMEGWEDDLILYGRLELLAEDYNMFRDFTRLPFHTSWLKPYEDENVVVLNLLK